MTATGTVTLVAKTRVKFGGEGHMDRNLGFVRTALATEVEPGESFEIDADTAEDLIASGAALTPEAHKAEQRESMTSEEKIEEMRAQIAEHDTKKKAKEGDSMAINENAHLEAQRREDEAIKTAQAKSPKKGAKAAEPTAKTPKKATSKAEPKGDGKGADESKGGEGADKTGEK